MSLAVFHPPCWKPWVHWCLGWLKAWDRVVILVLSLVKPLGLQVPPRAWVATIVWEPEATGVIQGSRS